jgi:asparagine synthase (glutamine-hydrolysing)
MKVDKMTMATSLEARCPYLDHQLVEFAWKLPSRAKVRGDVGKVLLREVATKLLPASLVTRRKQGLNPPVGRWLTNELADVARATIASGVIRDSALFDRAGLERLWSAVGRGEPGTARQMWALVNLGLWADRFKVSAA